MATALIPYDHQVGRYSPALARAFVRAAGIGPRARALDVGCGTGALAAELATLVGPERVAAVDPYEGSVAACADAVPGADVRVGAAEDLPFADAAFGAVLSQATTSAHPWGRSSSPPAPGGCAGWSLTRGSGTAAR